MSEFDKIALWVIGIYLALGVLFSIYHAIWMFINRKDIGKRLKTFSWITKVLVYDVFTWPLVLWVMIFYRGGFGMM